MNETLFDEPAEPEFCFALVFIPTGGAILKANLTEADAARRNRNFISLQCRLRWIRRGAATGADIQTAAKVRNYTIKRA